MPPSVRSYLVADNSPDKGVQASVASNQLVTVVAARMKKAVAGVVHETMHRIGAVNRVEREITQARHAIWKCQRKCAMSMPDRSLPTNPKIAPRSCPACAR